MVRSTADGCCDHEVSSVDTPEPSADTYGVKSQDVVQIVGCSGRSELAGLLSVVALILLLAEDRF